MNSAMHIADKIDNIVMEGRKNNRHLQMERPLIHQHSVLNISLDYEVYGFSRQRRAFVFTFCAGFTCHRHFHLSAGPIFLQELLKALEAQKSICKPLLAVLY